MNTKDKNFLKKHIKPTLNIKITHRQGKIGKKIGKFFLGFVSLYMLLSFIMYDTTWITKLGEDVTYRGLLLLCIGVPIFILLVNSDD